MSDNQGRTQRSFPRYATDRFVPAVVAGVSHENPLGGHIVDVSLGGARLVAAPNLTPSPPQGERLELVFARSDANRELDIDGLRIRCLLVHVREPPGARVLRLGFLDEAPPRLVRWVRSLSREGKATHADDLPEFDPDVWAGWAAISPGSPAP